MSELGHTTLIFEVCDTCTTVNMVLYLVISEVCDMCTKVIMVVDLIICEIVDMYIVHIAR